ncbi:MAG: hypothetical protein KDJ15_03105 [Alphaproteobacteria bacterium]|nr:hypothetical protein [Alphaproteobacteria bacterium]
MYSRLDPVFRTQFRQAETTDAGLHIPREDVRNEGRRKNGRKDEEEGQDLWEDSMAVSVVALQSFLAELIATQTPTEAEKEDLVLLSPPSDTAPAAETRQALAAYGHAAEITHKPVQRPPPHTVPEGKADRLTPEELRAIQKLLGSLKALQDRRIESITLRPAASFLQSLIDAVALAKDGKK